MSMKIAFRRATDLASLTVELYRELARSALRLLPSRRQGLETA
jgi:hypothetical protein